MQLQMFFKGPFADVTFIAHRTFIRPLPGVGSLVVTKNGACGHPPATIRAAEWLFPFVGLLMLIEGVFRLQVFPAFATLMRPLIRMGYLMLLQVFSAAETFLTSWTRIRSLGKVDFLMSCKGIFISKGLPTIRATIFFFLRDRSFLTNTGQFTQETPISWVFIGTVSQAAEGDVPIFRGHWGIFLRLDPLSRVQRTVGPLLVLSFDRPVVTFNPQSNTPGSLTVRLFNRIFFYTGALMIREERAARILRAFRRFSFLVEFLALSVDRIGKLFVHTVIATASLIFD